MSLFRMLIFFKRPSPLSCGLTRSIVIALLVLVWGHEALATNTIKVGIYRFPPFVDFNAAGEPEGLSLDILKRLNEVQNDYRFEAVVTSPSARYADFTAGQFDMMLFENLSWGWTQRDLPLQQTPEFMSGGERYIALSKPERTQNYFDDLSDKTIAAILGYHYGFADFKDDPEYLRQQFSARLVRRADDLIRAILAGHADIAVVTESLLLRNLKSTPDLKDKLLVSDRYDQVYSHRVVIRTDLTLSVADMTRLMERLATDPDYIALIRNYRGNP